MASIERKAYRIAEIATGNREDALDIVQDAMIALVTKYGEHDPLEWGAIFHRILQHKITDLHRKSSVSNRIKGWLGLDATIDDTEQEDPIQLAPDPCDGNPAKKLTDGLATEQLILALTALPARQKQAYLLRAIEGYNVEETADLMKCSQGSVKTHYSRALTALRLHLEAYWQ